MHGNVWDAYPANLMQELPSDIKTWCAAPEVVAKTIDPCLDRLVAGPSAVIGVPYHDPLPFLARALERKLAPAVVHAVLKGSSDGVLLQLLECHTSYGTARDFLALNDRRFRALACAHFRHVLQWTWRHGTLFDLDALFHVTRGMRRRDRAMVDESAFVRDGDDRERTGERLFALYMKYGYVPNEATQRKWMTTAQRQCVTLICDGYITANDEWSAVYSVVFEALFQEAHIAEVCSALNKWKGCTPYDVMQRRPRASSVYLYAPIRRYAEWTRHPMSVALHWLQDGERHWNVVFEWLSVICFQNASRPLVQCVLGFLINTVCFWDR